MPTSAISLDKEVRGCSVAVGACSVDFSPESFSISFPDSSSLSDSVADAAKKIKLEVLYTQGHVLLLQAGLILGTTCLYAIFNFAVLVDFMVNDPGLFKFYFKFENYHKI